jgi:hypothetical protein
MRRALSVYVFFGFGLLLAQSSEALTLFRSAMDEIRSTVKIPILLPTKLPFRAADIKLVRSDGAEPDRYWITLYLSEDGIASYAAGLGAAKPQPTSHKGILKLASGIRARFMPVSCGGSCTPANLWWVQGGVEYHIQLKLSVDTPLEKQMRLLVDTANSMIAVR